MSTGALSTSPKDVHVLIISGLPFRINSGSWRPVKDLLRALMRRELRGKSNGASDEPRVNIHNVPKGPVATASFKEEQYAKKLFDLLAGNSWHGSILAVCWIKVIPNHSEQRIGFSCHSSRPIQLEEVSPVRDKHLLLPMPASAFVPGPSGRRASVQQSVPGTQRSPRGPRAAGVGQNVSSPGLSPTAATFSSTASPYTGYIPVSVSMAPPPLPNPRPFTLEPQEHTQLQQLLSRHLSGSDTEYWTTDSLSPVSSSSTGSFSQSFTSISPHSNYGVVGSPPTQAQAMPYAGAATNTMHPTYRPAPSASRSAPQPQRKKMDKKEPEAEDEQSPEKEKGKRKGPGPVIADGSGDEWPT